MSNVVKVVYASDLNTDHFTLNNSTQKIEIAESILEGAGNGITELMFDNAQRKVTWKENGVAKEYDLSPLVTDIKVTSHEFVGGVLTLKQEGGADVAIDLNALSRVATSNTGNVTFTGDGTSQNPLVGNVEIPVYTGSEGVKVVGRDVQLDRDYFTVEIRNAFGNEVLGFAVPPQATGVGG